MFVTWEKTNINTWHTFNPDFVNIIPPGAEGVYVIFTNYNNIPITNYIGRGKIKDRLTEYPLYNPMRGRRMLTGSLYVTWTYIANENEQRNAEAYLIQNLHPIENKQRPLPINPFFTINLPW